MSSWTTLALNGLLFNTQKRPNRVPDVDAVAATGDFDPFTGNYFNRAAWTDPGPLAFGNAPKRDPTVRGFPNYSEDINFFKVFPLQNAHSAAVRGPVREYLRSGRLLRSGRRRPELELTGVRHDQHAVQHASVDSIRVQVRLLTELRSCRRVRRQGRRGA